MQCVIILAAVAATLYIVIFNIRCINGSYGTSDSKNAAALWTAVSHLLMELSVPVCGYCGAVYSNRQLLCCFCSCNLFTCVFVIITFIHLHIIIGDTDDCDDLEDGTQKHSCEVWKANQFQKWADLTSTVLTIIIGFVAFWSGNGLYSRLSRDPPAVPAITLVGEVVSLVPVAGQTAVQPGVNRANEASRWETSDWLPLPAGTLPTLGFRRPPWPGTMSV